MKFTADTHFSAMAEVEDFCRYVILERGIFFHPEDKFSAETAHISEEEASVWNRLVVECNAVCAANGTNLYDIIIQLTLCAGNARMN